MVEVNDEAFLKEQYEVLDIFMEMMSKNDLKNLKIEKIENISDGYIIYNFFSSEECLYLKQNIKYDQNVEFYRKNQTELYRKNDRLEILSKKLSSKIYERLEKYLPSKYIIETEDLVLGPLSQGEWKTSYLNPKWRFCRYKSEGLFGAHKDGCFLKNENERSFFTLMFYLNEDFEEGETAFLNEVDNSYILKVKPKEGMCIFFPQNILHEGRKTIGEKFIMRTDIVFERLNLNLSVEQMDNLKKADYHFAMAQELERCKQGMEAIEHYKKAFKLNPNLEKIKY